MKPGLPSSLSEGRPWEGFGTLTQALSSGLASGMPLLGWLVCISAVFLLVGPTFASFEIEARSPSVSGSLTSACVGLVRPQPSSLNPEIEPVSANNAIGGFAYRPFGIRDIDFAGVWSAISFGNRRLGLCYWRLAALTYEEHSLTMRYRLVYPNLILWPSVRLGYVSLDGEYLDGAMLLDLVSIAQVDPGLRLFAETRNLLAGRSFGSHEQCTVTNRLGLGLRLTSHLAVGFEITKVGGEPTSVASGFEFELGRFCLARCGARSFPCEYACGLSLHLGGFRFDIASRINPEIGLTHEVGCAYEW